MNISAFMSLNLSEIIVPNFPYDNKSIIYDALTGAIFLDITYGSSLNGLSSKDL